MFSHLAAKYRFLALPAFLLLTCLQANAQSVQPKANDLCLALKTNLLYDAATVPNAELEVTLGQHWSLMAEWAGAKWIDETEGRATQLHDYGIEARYWFNNTYHATSQPDPLHGFFAGAYASLCGYDLERDYRGCQDKECWSAGISGGYSFHLSQSFRLELSLGLGYMHSQYKHYHQETLPNSGKIHLVEHYQSNLNWIGPTKAKASIVWVPQLLKKKGDRR